MPDVDSLWTPGGEVEVTRAAVDQASAQPQLRELGAVGLNQFSGEIHEEFLRQLRGERGRAVFTEMGHNDGAIAGLLRAIGMPIRRAQWHFEPASEDTADQEAAEFLDGAIHDMSLSWSDFIQQVLSMLTFGWAWFEVVYKLRRGGDADPSSRFDDGRIGWRKFALRAQNTLVRWEFDDEGGIQAMIQRGDGFREIPIPIEKSLLFRTESAKNNPEGISVLRGAYRSWYFKSNLEKLEAIALERSGAGYPVVYMPRNAQTGSGSTDETNAKNLVRRIRSDEMAGVTLPGPKGGQGVDGWLLEFLSPPVGRGVGEGYHVAITRHKLEMLMSVLAHFIALGTQDVGSQALSQDQRRLFHDAVEGWVENIEDTFQRFAVPPLLRINAMQVSEPPKLTHSDIASPDLERVGTFVQRMTQSGILTPDDSLERRVREIGDLPDLPEGETGTTRTADRRAIDEANDLLGRLETMQSLDGTRDNLVDHARSVVKKLSRAVDARSEFDSEVDTYGEAVSDGVAQGMRRMLPADDLRRHAGARR